MAPTFAAILAAHLLGYVIFRADWAIKRQRRAWALVLHAVIVTSISYLLLGAFHWQILLVVFATHMSMGAIRVRFRADSLTLWSIDQSVHLGVLTALACGFPDAANGGWWIASASSEVSHWYFAALTLVSGLILCIPIGGNLIALLVNRFADELQDNGIAGLKQGGKYIGWLERFLVLLLLLMGQPNGIGFLIAAKSILRFGEIKDPSQRRVAEYIIIGTFLSFGWALTVSVFTQRALKYWLP